MFAVSTAFYSNILELGMPAAQKEALTREGPIKSRERKGALMSVNDPYKVLEISPEATDEEVKTAYREMARKYHPDNYANNPLSDLAQEKMQEINEAYDTIIRMRKQGGSGQAGGGSAARSTRFADIRAW